MPRADAEALRAIDAGQTNAELYPRLLGPAAWASLPAPVRALHLSATGPRAGVLAVTRGRSLGARLCGWMMRLPPAGERVHVELAVDRIAAPDQADVWRRSFDGWPLVTLQYERPGGVLAERMGRIECRFRLEARDGALVFHQVGAALCVGGAAVPLPRWFAPQIRATARALDDVHVRVDIAIAAPLFGIILSYAGEIAVPAGPRRLRKESVR